MWTLIRKEMLANVTSLRFILTLLLVMIVFIVSGFVFVGKYSQEVADFRNAESKSLKGLAEALKNLSKVPNYHQTIRRRPKFTQLCYEGFEKSLPNTFTVNAFSISEPGMASRTNFLFPRFADIL